MTRVYHRLREAIYHVSELEGKKLKGEIELNEAYFDGRRKGKRRGRNARGKSIVFGLLERGGRVYTRLVEHISKEELVTIIRNKTRKRSVYYSDTFRSYNSLKQLGKHLTVSRRNTLVDKRTKNHLMASKNFGVLRNIFCTTIEGFPNIIFRCISKRWSTDSIIATKTYLNASS